jgi:hypothetical protein
LFLNYVNQTSKNTKLPRIPNPCLFFSPASVVAAFFAILGIFTKKRITKYICDCAATYWQKLAADLSQLRKNGHKRATSQSRDKIYLQIWNPQILQFMFLPFSSFPDPVVAA